MAAAIVRHWIDRGFISVAILHFPFIGRFFLSDCAAVELRVVDNPPTLFFASTVPANPAHSGGWLSLFVRSPLDRSALFIPSHQSLIHAG